MQENLYNLAFERSILSSIIFEPQLIEDIHGALRTGDFYLPAHQNIYEVMLKLYMNNRPIDEEFIKKELITVKKFDEQVMLEILSANPIANIESYLDVMLNLSQKRSLLSVTTDIKKMTVEEEHDASDILNHIGKKLEQISEVGVSRLDSTGEFIDQFVHDYDHAGKEGPVGFKSGIQPLDNLLGWFEPGDLVVIAARPSMGKTALSTTIAHNALNMSNHGVLFDSMEMPGYKLMRRLIATRSEESISDLKKGLVKNPQKFKEALEFYRTCKSQKRLIVHELSYLSIAQLKAKASKIFRKNPHIKYWFIDHLRFIKRLGKNRDDLEVSEITKELKKLGKEFGVVVCLLQQLNRANEQRSNKRPYLSDLRDAGSIEEDADLVICPHRESYYNRNDITQHESPVNDAELIVLKNRDGEAGNVPVRFNGPNTTFTTKPITVHETVYMPEIQA